MVVNNLQACITQWSYEPCYARPPKLDGSQWRVLTRHGPLEKEMATNSSILTWRTPWTVWKDKKIWRQKISPPRSEGVQYAPGEEWRAIANSSSKNEATGPKQKWCSAMDVSGGESKVQCYKEQYCTGTRNVRSMNQGKLEVVKQEMVRLNIDILGSVDHNRWEWVNLIQMTIVSITVGKNPLE